MSTLQKRGRKKAQLVVGCSDGVLRIRAKELEDTWRFTQQLGASSNGENRVLADL